MMLIGFCLCLFYFGVKYFKDSVLILSRQNSAWLNGLFAFACLLTVAAAIVGAIPFYLWLRTDCHGDPRQATHPTFALWGIWLSYGLLPAVLLPFLMWCASAPESLLYTTFVIVWLVPFFSHGFS